MVAWIAALASIALTLAACGSAPPAGETECGLGRGCEDPARPYCLAGTCVGCTGDGDCPLDAAVCDLGTHSCQPCESILDCTRFADAPVCEAGVCIACTSPGLQDDACPFEQPVCDATSGGCRPCVIDDECDTDCDETVGWCQTDETTLFVASGAPLFAPCIASEPCGSISWALTHVDLRRRWVRIAPGTYEDSLEIIRDEGVLEETVWIQAEGVLLMPQGSPGLIARDGTHVGVLGMTIRAAGEGVVCRREAGFPAAQILLEGVTIEDSADAGVTAGCTVELAAVELRGNAEGLRIATGDVVVGPGTVFRDNLGAGISIEGGQLTGRRFVIAGNVGGGLVVDGESIVTVENAFVVGNGGPDAAVGGMRFAEVGPSGVLTHVTVTANQSTGPAAGLDCGPSIGNLNVTVRDSIVSGNVGALELVGCSSSDIFGVDVTGEPGFVDAAAGDYRLLPTSEAIDLQQDENGVVEDFDGEPRPFGGFGDLGADEYVP